MIMAARARDRQPEEATSDHVDPVVDDVVGISHEMHPDGQEPHRAQRARGWSYGAHRPTV